MYSLKELIYAMFLKNEAKPSEIYVISNAEKADSGLSFGQAQWDLSKNPTIYKIPDDQRTEKGSFMETIWKVCFLVSLIGGIISAPVIGAEQKQNKLPEQKQKVSEKKKPLKNGSGIAEGRENIRSETCNPQLLPEFCT